MKLNSGIEPKLIGLGAVVLTSEVDFSTRDWCLEYKHGQLTSTLRPWEACACQPWELSLWEPYKRAVA